MSEKIMPFPTQEKIDPIAQELLAKYEDDYKRMTEDERIMFVGYLEATLLEETSLPAKEAAEKFIAKVKPELTKDDKPYMEAAA